MPKLPRITGNEVVRAFVRAGFYVASTQGSHVTLKRDDLREHLTVPVHAGKTLGPGLLNKLIKTAGMTREQFIALL